ncbi:FAD-binding domain-containing protein [Xylaria sp. FL0064]|nr:FAD-binding domain-containing protein [Xylaria sp. FL0064]
MARVADAVGLCCLTLARLFNGTVSYPDSSTYAASLASYFTSQQTAIHPRCIVTPNSADEVSTILRVLTNETSANSACPFAVRAGGHGTSVGTSNVQGGVTIDLRGLSDITLNQDKNILSVGAGVTMGAVYSYLDPLNMSAVGGRASSVGVAGLTLGGGISYFGPRYGWACDNVKNFEVVLANGSIVNANEKENPRLLWALRGGAGNFGIVTRIDMQTFEQGDLWGGTIIQNVSTKDAVTAALAQFSQAQHYDKYASLLTTFGYSQGQLYIVNGLQYTGNVEDPSVFQPFLEMPSLSSTLGRKNMTTLAAETEALQMIGQREAYATMTISPTAEAIDATVTAWNASVGSVQNIEGLHWSVNFDPLPATFYTHNANGNALGLASRGNKPLMVILLSVTWANAEDDPAVDVAMRGLIRTMQRDTARLGALDPFLYLNYAAAWQNPLASYGPASTAKLSEIQRAYDRRDIFTLDKPGGFKVEA